MTKRKARQVRKIIRNTTLSVITVGMFCVCSWYEAHYTREAIVIDVTDNTITAIDKCNYVWKFCGDGFKVDDEIKITMDTMNTDNYVFDDEVKNVKIITK